MMTDDRGRAVMPNLEIMPPEIPSGEIRYRGYAEKRHQARKGRVQ